MIENSQNSLLSTPQQTVIATQTQAKNPSSEGLVAPSKALPASLQTEEGKEPQEKTVVEQQASDLPAPHSDETGDGTEDMQIEDSDGINLKSEATNAEEEAWEANSDVTGEPPSPPDYASDSNSDSRDLDFDAKPDLDEAGGIYVQGKPAEVSKTFVDEDLEALRELEERKLQALKAIEESQAHVLLQKAVVMQSSQRRSMADHPAKEEEPRPGRLLAETLQPMLQNEIATADEGGVQQQEVEQEPVDRSERSGGTQDTIDSIDLEGKRAECNEFVDAALVYYHKRRRERFGKLGEMLWYLVFISIATSLLLVSQSSLVGQMHATQVKQWLNKSIESVTTVEQVLPYVKNVLLDRHYSASNIPNDLVMDAGMYGMFPRLSERGRMLGNNLVVGLLEMRQWRAPEQYCKAPTLLGSNFMRCFPELDRQHRDIRTNPPGTTWPVDDNQRSPPWSFFQLPEYATPVYSSFDRSYEQGSYTAILPDSPIEAEQLFADLIKYRWLDGNATRAVQLEFSTYNPNVNIWSACSILFEQSLEGRLIRTIFVRNADICPSCSNISKDSYALTIVVLVLVVFYTLLQLFFLQQQGLAFFFQWYNLVSCLNLIIFYVVIAVQVSVKSDANHNLLSSHATVTTQVPGYVYWLVQASYWNSFNALLLWIKLLKFCDSTSYKAETLVNTFFRSLAPFLALAVCYSIAYGGFVLAFTMILGADDLRFYSYMRTARTQFSMLSGSGPYFKDIPAVDGSNDFGLISIIGVVYQLGMKIFGLGFFVAIILFSYQRQLRREASRQSLHDFRFSKAAWTLIDSCFAFFERLSARFTKKEQKNVEGGGEEEEEEEDDLERQAKTRREIILRSLPPLAQARFQYISSSPPAFAHALAGPTYSQGCSANGSKRTSWCSRLSAASTHVAAGTESGREEQDSQASHPRQPAQAVGKPRQGRPFASPPLADVWQIEEETRLLSAAVDIKAQPARPSYRWRQAKAV
eukprot:762766-Hanusia_phi.AAC.3